MVASFTKTQIRSVETWVKNNVVLTEGSNSLQAFSRALRVAEVDEKGKVMDEKSRTRIRYGMRAISELHKRNQDLDRVQGSVAVWQVGSGEGSLSVRFEVEKGWRGPRYNRY